MSGYLTFTSIPRVDRLSTDPWDLGCHNRTTARKPTNISPFALTYGMEAVILIEISLPTIRTATPESENVESVVKELDASDELRDAVAIRVASYQRRLATSYNKRMKPRAFQPGDLVLRRVF